MTAALSAQLMTDLGPRKAVMIEDSISRAGVRLASIQVTFWRPMLAELNTHRAFTRSARSSRAVPIAKMIDEVRTAHAKPVKWTRNQPGMQGRQEIVGDEALECDAVWKKAALQAADRAEDLARLKVHKQEANRLLEPFLFVHVLITAVDWRNMLGLRLHGDAQPDFQLLAQQIYAALAGSVPTFRDHNDWHLPYITAEDRRRLGWPNRAIQVSVARSARVSYKPFDSDNPSTLAEDLDLYEKLVGSQPIHASPAEHQAQPDWTRGDGAWAAPDLHGNLRGWRQYRKSLPKENMPPLPEGYGLDAIYGRHYDKHAQCSHPECDRRFEASAHGAGRWTCGAVHCALE